MTNYRNVSIGGRIIRVRAGGILLDGALANGVDIPHDCRAGTCGTCMVQVVKGQTVYGETHTRGMVHACQARVLQSRHQHTAGTPAAYGRPLWAGFPAFRKERQADTGWKRHRLRPDLGHRLYGAARIQGPPYCYDRWGTQVTRALHDAGIGAA